MLRIVLILILFYNFNTLAYSNERLQLYYLTEKILTKKIINLKELMQFNELSQSLGFEVVSSDQQINYSVKVNRAIYPIVAFSDNINGGNLNQTIKLGDITFIADEDTKAKSGIIVGVGALLGIKKLYNRGRYIDLNLNTSITAAPAHDWLKVRNGYITACSKNHIKEWIFIDACASWDHTKKEFSDTINKSISTSFTRLFMSGKSFNESSIIAKRFISDEYQQFQG